MKDKYYTPQIEEFHVGFEFEFLPPIWAHETERAWTKYNWGSRLATVGLHGDCISIGGTTMKDDCLRVKYLDQEDIESLGWTQEMVLNVWSENDSDFVDGFVLNTNNTDKYVLLYDNENNTCGIYLQRIYNEMSGNWEEHKMFSGIIENKSELKKLMQQLQIL